jgi:hypothetical protein
MFKFGMTGKISPALTPELSINGVEANVKKD